MAAMAKNTAPTAAAHGHGTRLAQQPVAAAVTTTLTPVGAITGGSQKRTAPPDVTQSPAKLVAVTVAAQQTATTATTTADVAGTQDQGASAEEAPSATTPLATTSVRRGGEKRKEQPAAPSQDSRRRRTTTTNQDDAAAATDHATAPTTAHDPDGAPDSGAEKRSASATTMEPPPKRRAPQEPATTTADAAGTQGHGASADDVLCGDDGEDGESAAAARARKRTATAEQESSDAPAAKRACGTAAHEDSSTTDHCMLALEEYKYRPAKVKEINKYLHDRYRRRLHVVAPDGDCAFHTISFFSAIPHDVLRWTAAVATAIRVAATSHLAPQTDAAQKVHALLAYYSEELMAARDDKHPRKAKKASAVVGAVAVNAEQLMEQAAALAVNGILNPKEWVESSVLALVCGILQLPLAVLTVADQADISKWYVLPLFETKADYSQQIVADAVRLAVFFSDHYSPCLLEAPVHAAEVVECLTFPQVVDVLCEEVYHIRLAALPQLVPGAVDVQVRVLCCAVCMTLAFACGKATNPCCSSRCCSGHTCVPCCRVPRRLPPT